MDRVLADTKFATPADTGKITVEGKPELKFIGFVKYTVGNEVVGSLDATFDFSKLPPELHADAVRFLSRGGYNMQIGSVAHLYWPAKYETPEPLRLSHRTTRTGWWRTGLVLAEAMYGESRWVCPD